MSRSSPLRTVLPSKERPKFAGLGHQCDRGLWTLSSPSGPAGRQGQPSNPRRHTNALLSSRRTRASVKRPSDGVDEQDDENDVVLQELGRLADHEAEPVRHIELLGHDERQPRGPQALAQADQGLGEGTGEHDMADELEPPQARARGPARPAWRPRCGCRRKR